MKTFNISLFFSILFILATIMFAYSGEKVIKTPDGTNIAYLKNGMKLVLKEDHSNPLVCVMICVKVGARYEDAETNGMSHLLEHLLFDGTKTKTREQIKNRFENYGGYDNAFTTKDYTAYQVVMPSEFIEIGIENQADMLLNSIIPDDELAKERNVVIEEIKKDSDNPLSYLDDLFDAKRYKGTPYARNVIGFDTLIANVPKEKIMEYYKSHYVPNNFTAIAFGDFNTNEIIKVFEKYYGKVPKAKIPEHPSERNVPIKSQEYYKELFPTDVIYVKIGYEAPLISDSLAPAFEVLTQILIGSDDSRIYKAVMGGKKPLATSISGYYEKLKDVSSFNISLQFNDESNIDSTLKLIDNEILKVKKEKVSKEELSRAKLNIKANSIFSTNNYIYGAYTFVDWEAKTRYEDRENYYKRIEKITEDDIIAVAQKYPSMGYSMGIFSVEDDTLSIKEKHFEYLNRVVVMLKPGGQKPENEKTRKREISDFRFPIPNEKKEKEKEKKGKLEKPKQSKVENQKSKIEKKVLDNGLTLLVKEYPTTQISAVHILVGNRMQLETDRTNGISHFVTEMLDKGTKNRTREQIALSIADIGAVMKKADDPYIPYDDYYTWDRDYAFVRFETLNEYFPQGLEILSDMIKNCNFPDNEIEKARQSVISIIARNDKNVSRVANELFFKSLFPKNAYSLQFLGTKESISSITKADLEEYYRKAYSPNNLIISAVTNRPADETMQLLEKYFGDMPKVDYSLPSYNQEDKLTAPINVKQRVDKEQASVVIGFRLPSIKSADVPAIEVMSLILSNRLGLELREKQGLAYSVGAGANFSKDVGWLMAKIGTRNENIDKAKDGILAEMNKLKNELVSQDEINIRLNDYWGRTLRFHQTSMNQAYYLGLYEFLGVGYEYDSSHINEMRKVKPEDIMRVAKQYLDTDNYTAVIVGKVE